MKGAVAAWAAALASVLARAEPQGSLSVLLTSDEEGVALDGTKRVVAQLQAEGERIDGCVVGEPSSVAVLGDTMKIGRRGSLNATITAVGVQGHVAYPDRAANPVPVLIELLARLGRHRLDDGWPAFPPSNLEVTTVDVGNPAGNVIPARATARLNIRFNPAQKGDDLIAWLQAEVTAAARDGVQLTVGRAPLRRRLSDRARAAHGGGRGRRAGGAGPSSGALDQRRHLRRALHAGDEPRGGAGAGGRHHPPGGRTDRGGRPPRAPGRL
jgi:acetylornithine deacetylase/succinyl-diaminopimelate desuccinylase-like protein